METKHTPTPVWILDDYTDAPDAWGIYEENQTEPDRLVCELLNCDRKDAERIINHHNAHDDLVEEVKDYKAALEFYAKNCPQNSLDGPEGFPTAILAQASLNKHKLRTEALAKAKAGA